MPLFGTEMRHIDMRRRVIGQEPRDLTAFEAAHTFAEPQNRQGAKQAARIDIKIKVHPRRHKPGALSCPRICDRWPRDLSDPPG